MFILFFGWFINYLLRKSLIGIAVFIIPSRLPEVQPRARCNKPCSALTHKFPLFNAAYVF